MKEFYSVWSPDGLLYFQGSRKRGATHKALDMIRFSDAPIDDSDRKRLDGCVFDTKYDILVECNIIKELHFQ